MLERAAAEFAAAQARALPNPDDCAHLFSAKFERRTNRLIRRTKHPVLYRTVQSAACLALLILLGFASVLTVSAEARGSVLGWITQRYPAYCEIILVGKTEDTADPPDVAYNPGCSATYDMHDADALTHFTCTISRGPGNNVTRSR